MWMTKSYFHKNWIFLANLDEVITLKSWRVAWDHFWEISPLLMKQATCALIFFPNPFCQVVHNRPLLLRGESPTQIVHHMWKILAFNLAPTIWATHGTTSQNKQMPTQQQNPTCLEYEVFISCFGPHDSGHHLTLVNSFHPRRLPPSGLQTPS